LPDEHISQETTPFDQSPNSLLPQIMHDGIIYYLDSNGRMDAEFELSENAPRIMSVVPLSQVPSENRQANFGEVDAVYTRHGNGLAISWNGYWTMFLPQVVPVSPSTNIAQAEVHDVAMRIQDATASGLSFYYENISDKEYIYSEEFTLYVKRNARWELAEPIIGNGAFNEPAYFIPPQNKTDIVTVDWRWLYGELPSGEYKFQKRISFIREPGDLDIFVTAQDFTIP
jgi:hypothetical protein